MNFDDDRAIPLAEAERLERAAHLSADLSAAVERLAKLSPLEYDRCRQDEATRLGVRVATLDAEVKAARGDGGGGSLQGRALELPTPEPAAEPVEGAALLDALAEAATRYVALPEHGAIIVALWILHSHCVAASPITPRLAIISPTKRCGKSTLLRLLTKVVAKPLPAENVTAAALFRTIEKARPTLLIDEADAFLTGSDELRGVLNAGHHRDGNVIRTSGDDFEPRQFSTWAAVAIAAIGKLPGTIEDRAILIRMRRRRPDERIERFRGDRCEDLKQLGRQAARWTADNGKVLAAADPEIPAKLHDRQADNWRPLIAIADLAGEGWHARARAAATASARDGEGGDDAAGVELLADIRKVFAEAGTDRLPSADLVRRLTSLEDRRWCEWRHGKPMTVRQLARLLAPYDIAPATIRVGETTAKGYPRAGFDDPFARYLPSDPSHRHNPQGTAVFQGFSSVTSAPDVTDRKCPKATESATCDGVTDEKGGPEEDMSESSCSSIGGRKSSPTRRPAETETVEWIK
jgi:putative DNA primase/helicase